MTTAAETLETQTATEIRDQALDDLAALGCSLFGVNTESADRGLIEIHANALAAEQQIRAAIARAAARHLVMTIEDVATRDGWMDVAAAWYSLTRLPATKASHRIRLTGSAGSPAYTIAPGQLVAQTEDRVQFRNTGRLSSDINGTPGTIILAAAGTRDDLEWQAELAGTDGNISANTPLELVTSLAGVSASNPPIGSTGSSLLRSGTAIETSESLDKRCDSQWDRTAVSQLPGAFIQWIIEAFETRGEGSPIIKWLVDDTNPNGPASTDVYISSGGGATAGELAIVDPYLQARRARGSGNLRTLSSVPVNVSFTAQLYQRGASTTNAADCNTALDILELILALGGTLYGDDITKALRSVSDIYHVTHSLEGITTTVGPNEEIVLVPTLEFY